jgi:hypothetical protein
MSHMGGVQDRSGAEQIPWVRQGLWNGSMEHAEEGDRPHEGYPGARPLVQGR